MGFQSWEIGLSGRGEQTGLLVAAAVAPGTFEPSLVPRTTADQGMVMARGQCCRTQPPSRYGTRSRRSLPRCPRLPAALASRQRAAAALLDLAVISTGPAAQRA